MSKEVRVFVGRYPETDGKGRAENGQLVDFPREIWPGSIFHLGPNDEIVLEKLVSHGITIEFDEWSHEIDHVSVEQGEIETPGAFFYDRDMIDEFIQAIMEDEDDRQRVGWIAERIKKNSLILARKSQTMFDSLVRSIENEEENDE